MLGKNNETDIIVFFSEWYKSFEAIRCCLSNYLCIYVCVFACSVYIYSYQQVEVEVWMMFSKNIFNDSPKNFVHDPHDSNLHFFGNVHNQVRNIFTKGYN